MGCLGIECEETNSASSDLLSTHSVCQLVASQQILHQHMQASVVKSLSNRRISHRHLHMSDDNKFSHALTQDRML